MQSGKCTEKDCCKKDNAMMGKCDMNECSKMNKEECAKMCDEKGCSSEEKAMCLSHFGKDGKWIGGNETCAKDKKDCCKKH
jgi:K(+)-stimulated pyrophosphate-energized sodium pump